MSAVLGGPQPGDATVDRRLPWLVALVGFVAMFAPSGGGRRSREASGRATTTPTKG